MDKSLIYIVSSERAQTLAEILSQVLAEKEYCAARSWQQLTVSNPGKTKIEILEEAARNYDFAVILLTEGDIKATGGDDELKARDDCIFEAGLFMASIGRERCFPLVSSGSKTELPADLGGIEPCVFTEPKNLANRSACAGEMRGVSGDILDTVQRLGPRVAKSTMLSRRELLKRERHQDEHGNLKEDQVVVTSALPLETDYEAARIVRDNIERNIKYVYFFEGRLDGAEKTCMLLQWVLLANILKQQNAIPFHERCSKVAENKAKILKDFEWICNNNYITIYFLPAAPEFPYCIHNASDPSLAALYLKHGTAFIEWERDGSVWQFWKQIKERWGVEGAKPEHAIFHAAPGFNLGDFHWLKRMVMKYFPSIGEAVFSLCLNGPGGETAQGQPDDPSSNTNHSQDL